MLLSRKHTLRSKCGLVSADDVALVSEEKSKAAHDFLNHLSWSIEKGNNARPFCELKTCQTTAKT